jgi:hypothetical protein
MPRSPLFKFGLVGGTEIACVDHLGAHSLEHGRDAHRALALHSRPGHEGSGGSWAAGALLR